MNDNVLMVLIVVAVLLLAALFIFEKRRQRADAKFRSHLEELEREERYEEIEEILEYEDKLDNLPTRQAFKRFLRGRPTRHLSAEGLWDIYNGIVAIGLLGFVLFLVFRSAFYDSVVRLILATTFAAGFAIWMIARIRRRGRRERDMLP